MNVFLFGGSFDPPHIAHVLAVSYVLATEEVDLVAVVPCFQHPFAKELAPFADRFEMCRRAMEWLPRTEVLRVEEELGGESRTLRTVEHLHKVHPDWRLRLILGADVLLDGPRWQGFDRVTALAPPVILGRAGVATDKAPPAVLPEVSSSAIRDALRQGRAAQIAPLLPRGVLAYIEDRGLYRAP
ncbi:MAG: nicotinate (nicotinamide) nucleotide adenylyltransferase [Polyangiaceae bacterium]